MIYTITFVLDCINYKLPTELIYPSADDTQLYLPVSPTYVNRLVA